LDNNNKSIALLYFARLALVLFQLMLLTERLETPLNRETQKNLQCFSIDEDWFDPDSKATPIDRNMQVSGNPVLNHIPPRQQPGIYMIRCDVNDKRYYGETSNLSNRISKHKKELRQNIHPTHQMQNDWNDYGEEKFDFVILYLGESWNKRQARIKKETELINADRSLCYNLRVTPSKAGEFNPFYGKKHTEQTKASIGDAQKGVPKDLLGTKICLDGKIYKSISSASRETNHARRTIRQWLNDPDNPRCQLVRDED